MFPSRSLTMARRRNIPVLVLAVLLATKSGQAQSPLQAGGHFETRTELTAEMQAAEARNEKARATLIRARLERGDFREGDRIIVRIEGSAGVSDTLTVRPGNRLELPQMNDVSLDGVLRSELVPKLTVHVAQYLRNPVVRATPLVRVGVLGSVSRPGYYYTSAEVPLTDVLMMAGGPAADADLKKTTIRRGSEMIVDEAKAQNALSQGTSLDMLHMIAGDAIEVGRKTQFNWLMAVSSFATVVGLLLAVKR
jgi:protein involved in polysaccharide export with SLBB domain